MLDREILDIVARYRLPDAVRDELLALVEEDDASVTPWDAGATLPFDDEPTAAPPPQAALFGPAPDVVDRYEDRGSLGAGGMSMVRRCFDRHLGREVAMKVLLNPSGRVSRVERFTREIRHVAAMQHPNIVPIYDVGTLPDGRPFFTMPVVEGYTLLEAIERGRIGLHRMLEVVRTVCEVAAFAHGQGIIHRDLKPQNVMIGQFGEVWVLDWGLVGPRLEEREQAYISGDELSTRDGMILGTPAYMAPEQAIGAVDAVGTLSDVYALGATLRHVLTGEAPRAGAAVDPSDPPEAPVGVDSTLWRVACRAMALLPPDRYPAATDVGAAIGAWLDGSERRRQAVAELRRARTLLDEVARLRRVANEAREASAAALFGVPTWAPVADKEVGWAHADRAADADADADAAEAEAHQRLAMALAHDRAQDTAHALLADHWHRQHRDAELARDRRAAARALPRLRHHDRGAYTGYLRGIGVAELRCEGFDRVRIGRYRTERRVWDVEPVEEHTTLPHRLELPIGSYVAEMVAGDNVVCVPFVVDREIPWIAGDVVIADLHRVGPDACPVPAGPFRCGGDPLASSSLPSGAPYVDGFALARQPVTNAEYIAFLDALVADGEVEEAEHRAPRSDPLGGNPLFTRTDAGWVLGEDPFGTPNLPAVPVRMITWDDAIAYAAWLADRTGIDWRLPTELEWEKAARGVDGRIFPWGQFLDPSLCCMRSSGAGRAYPVPVDRFPTDTSPYGVRHMAGNISEWTASPYYAYRDVVGEVGATAQSGDDELMYAVRGGGFGAPERVVRLASRAAAIPGFRMWGIGFRLARSLERA